jgi:hypothetical protein
MGPGMDMLWDMNAVSKVFSTSHERLSIGEVPLRS